MRVTIAEDSALLREGLAQLLASEGHDVVATVDTAPALLASVATTPPDLVLVDVRMPPDFVDEGIHAALHIRQHHPHVAVLVLSQYVERQYARHLLNGRGGVGYLLKDRVSYIPEFLDALERVRSGGTAFDPEVIRQLLNYGDTTDQRLARLTERERAVLELMAQGHSNTSISATLYLSQSAVEKHINALFSKLGLAGDAVYNRRVLAVLTYLGNR